MVSVPADRSAKMIAMRSFLVATLIAAGLLAAGCGGGGSSSSGTNGEASKSGQQVLSDAVKAAEAASSVHVSGQIDAAGQQIGLDITLVKGKGATGSMTLGGQKVDLVVIGSDVYIKAGTAFWTQFGGTNGSTVAPMLQGKWVKVPASNTTFAELSSLTDSTTFFHGLGSVSGTVKNDGATTYKGQKVVAIESQGKLYVANTGTPYPVAAVASGTATAGTLAFGGWNKAVTLSAPSGALDFSHVSG